MKNYKKIFKDINEQIHPNEKFLEKLEDNIKEKLEKKKQNIFLKRMVLLLIIGFIFFIILFIFL